MCVDNVAVQITDHEVAARLAALQLATEAEFIPGRVDIALGASLHRLSMASIQL